jgi:xanthine dehydrogenase accessory factor
MVMPPTPPTPSVLDELAAATARGQRAVLVTVLAVEGEAPSRPGAKLVVAEGDRLAGTLGCAEFDTAGLKLAGEVIDQGMATVRRRMVFGHGEERALDLFAEVYEPQPAVVVLGATPIGRAVAELARFVGRRVTLLNDTESDVDPLGPLRSLGLGPRDAVVLSDHDASYVDDVLRFALAGPVGFVGMIGSRRHAPEAVRRLRESGVPVSHLARLRSPLGLDIGSRSPEEIALSIVAEVVAAERGRAGGRMGIDWTAPGT